MLIYKNMYLHNIYELEEYANYTQFFRFPKSLKPHLESSGDVSSILHGCELRFIITGDVELELVSLSTSSSQVIVYYGDFQDQPYTIGTEPTKLNLSSPFEPRWLNTIKDSNHRFSPLLVRVVLYEKIALCNISGQYELPTQSDLPNSKVLAYGTSITQGRRSFYPDINYPQIFAERIGYDLDNLAMSGSCFIEPQYVDFLMDRKYDLILLCLSTNMLGKGYHPDVFKQRVTYLFDKIKETNPNTPVIAISILTSYRDLELIRTDLTNTNNRHIYRTILKDLCGQYNFNYLPGNEILKHYHLTHDLLHPGHYGMIEISENLVKYFNQNIKKSD